MSAVRSWLFAPRTLLRLVIDELCAKTRAWRNGVLLDPPSAEASQLRHAGSDICEMLFFPGLASNISELARPGSSTEDFSRDVLKPLIGAMLRLRTYQLERNHVVCSPSAMVEQLVKLLRQLLLRETETVQMALMILYCASIIPSHWLPDDVSFCRRVQLYSSLRSSSVCNIPELNRRLVSALYRHIEDGPKEAGEQVCD